MDEDSKEFGKMCSDIIHIRSTVDVISGKQTIHENRITKVEKRQTYISGVIASIVGLIGYFASPVIRKFIG